MNQPQLAPDKPDLIIYCQKWCDYMHHLVNMLQELGWSFMFIDLRFNHKAGQELISVLGKPVPLPVLEFGGQYYVKPELAELPDLLKEGRGFRFFRGIDGSKT